MRGPEKEEKIEREIKDFHEKTDEKNNMRKSVQFEEFPKILNSKKPINEIKERRQTFESR